MNTNNPTASKHATICC